MNFTSSTESNEIEPGAPRLKVPRIESLEHRLRHARDADGNPSALRDELLCFLDDPPAGTSDRWQKGADLCERHGIKVSRMAVWRFYHAHILQWREEQLPPASQEAPKAADTLRLHERARHFAARRLLVMLHDPRLSPGQLIAYLQSDNRRAQVQLASDQFDDRVCVRLDQEKRDLRDRIEKKAQNKTFGLATAHILNQVFPGKAPVKPHNTP